MIATARSRRLRAALVLLAVAAAVVAASSGSDSELVGRWDGRTCQLTCSGDRVWLATEIEFVDVASSMRRPASWPGGVVPRDATISEGGTLVLVTSDGFLRRFSSAGAEVQAVRVAPHARRASLPPPPAPSRPSVVVDGTLFRPTAEVGGGVGRPLESDRVRAFVQEPDGRSVILEGGSTQAVDGRITVCDPICTSRAVGAEVEGVVLRDGAAVAIVGRGGTTAGLLEALNVEAEQLGKPWGMHRLHRRDLDLFVQVGPTLIVAGDSGPESFLYSLSSLRGRRHFRRQGAQGTSGGPLVASVTDVCGVRDRVYFTVVQPGTCELWSIR